jgi:hypothetical protein
MRKIKEKSLPQITKLQLVNLKARIGRSKRKTLISFDQELKNWCASRCSVPTDVDQVFCGGLDFSVDSDSKVFSDLRLFLTTKRLVSLTQYGTVLSF